MAYSDTLRLVAGDTLPVLTLTLKDKNTAAPGQTLDENDSSTWAPIDVTGATVVVRIRSVGSTTVLATLTCTLSDPSNGEVTTDFPGPTFTSAGTYEGEVEITFSGGGIQTVYDLLKFKVRSDFD